jgi:methyltransferase (TIGR00027 family)
VVRAVGVDFFSRWATGELDPADVDPPDTAWSMRPMADLMAARTRYFDNFLLDAMAAGIRQAVILASGRDARGYRLAWPSDTKVFEIDQPQVIEFKTATIARLGAEPIADLRAVPIDLRHDWPKALREAGFDPGQPAAWIAEGLLAFLPPAAQDLLLDNVAALSGPGSRLAAEIFVNAPDADNGQPANLLDSATARWREHGLDIELSALGYDGERHDVAAYLDEHGWRVVRTPSSTLLADNGLPAIPPTNGRHSPTTTTARRRCNPESWQMLGSQVFMRNNYGRLIVEPNRIRSCRSCNPNPPIPSGFELTSTPRCRVGSGWSSGSSPFRTTSSCFSFTSRSL